MAETKPPRGRSGRPPRTSRAEVLNAARQIIERDGWEKLTIRRLAGEVGVSAMTIYHHVEDRGDLLVQLLNDRLADLTRPELPADPRQRILTTAELLHQILAEQPWIAEVLTTDGFLSRLGETPIWIVDAIVGAALDAGCSDENAILILRNLWYYIVGEILVRANTKRQRTTNNVDSQTPMFSRPDPAIRDRDTTRLPALARVGGLWTEVAARDTFSQGLQAFVDGLLPHFPASERG
ncbi:MAG TPA: TetR/AcrR family transcriptional regulator [Aeromicrobium sp.]|nr:TetR/AcrR family transcriptional regulator [Aeromicrobium sp.]